MAEDLRPHVVGYPDRLGARPGERLDVMATSDRRRRAAVALVRLATGGRGAAGAEPVAEPVAEVVVEELGEVAVGPQRTQSGSFMVAARRGTAGASGAFVASVLVSPSRLGRPQCLLGQADPSGSWSIELDVDGRAVALSSAGPTVCEAVAEVPVVEGAWFLVAAGFDPAAGIRLAVRPLAPTASWRVAPDDAMVPADAEAPAPPIGGLLGAPFVVAAQSVALAPGCYDRCFDGRLERPLVLEGVLDEALAAALVAGTVPSERLLAGWDFARRLGADGADGTTLEGEGPAAGDGVLWNTPLEAATGHAWSGREQDFRLAPEEYAAIHFHADDLDDCRWAPALTVELPADLASGVYAVRFTAASEADPAGPADQAGPPDQADQAELVDRVPFFVRPSAPSAPLLFLAPTASYLAYANDHPVADGDFSEATASRTPIVYDDDLLLHEHREWGLSCYDSHLDGSGVAVSTARRPLVNMRPSHRYHVGTWQLPADLALLEWLDAEGIAYDVATDEDLHRDGSSVLAPYTAVLSGTHPEYYSTAMLEAVESYLSGGGRLVHLGANGYYWRVAFDRQRPWVMELRRGQSGSRAWESAPGEGHLAFSGERGGLWRHLGRPPQRLTGVGYAAQGFDRSGWYRRQPDSYDERAAFLFDGVEGEVFGTAGTIGGGAVGQELDRYDGSLGTPRDALLLATSEGLTEGYQRCVEEVLFTVPGTSARLDPDVRADVVYHVKPGGGAVFATGSIAWAGALGLDDGITRITRNVLDRFVDPAPLPW